MFSWKKVAAAIGISAVMMSAAAVQAIPVRVETGSSSATHKVSTKAPTSHRVTSTKHKTAPVSKKSSKTASAKHKTTASHHVATTTHRKGTATSHVAKPATHLTASKPAARPVSATHTKA